MCSFATKFVVESWSTIAEADTMFAPSPTIAVVKLLLELEPDMIPAPNPKTAAVDNEPLISSDNCADADTILAPSITIADVKLLLELEPDIIPAPNPMTAAVDKEPLISVAI